MAASRGKQGESTVMPMVAAVGLAVGLIALMITLNGCHSEPACVDCAVQLGGRRESPPPAPDADLPPDAGPALVPAPAPEPPPANPPAAVCAGLAEEDCSSEPDCQPILGGACGMDSKAAKCNGADCDCTAPAFDHCEPQACGLVSLADLCSSRTDCQWIVDEASCHPCDCPAGEVGTPACVCSPCPGVCQPRAVDPCAGLDEEQCQAAPDVCTPYYSADHCVCDPSGACACESEVFQACQPNPPTGA